MDITPIETEYKGYRFRSRTEARWAVFFDAAGVPWEYEKEGYPLDAGWYLPDFWIPNPMPEFPCAGYWVEVKPRYPDPESLADAQKKLQELTEKTKHTSHIICGQPGQCSIGFWNYLSTKWLPLEDIAYPDEAKHHQSMFYLVYALTHKTPRGTAAEAVASARQAKF